MIYLSEFYSRDGTRKAVVLKENDTIYVSCISDSGTSYRAEFETQQGAEDFAEDWVLGEKDE